MLAHERLILLDPTFGPWHLLI